MLRQLETHVRRIERRRRRKEGRAYNIVWWLGKPRSLPAELDPKGTYCHYFIGDRPSDAEMDRVWRSLPVRGGKHSARRRDNG